MMRWLGARQRRSEIKLVLRAVAKARRWTKFVAKNVNEEVERVDGDWRVSQGQKAYTKEEERRGPFGTRFARKEDWSG